MKPLLLPALLCLCLNLQAQKFCEFNVYFETAKWDILPSEQKKIDSVLALIGPNVKFDIKATGHTDKRGGIEYNQRLSEKRAGEVVSYINKRVDHRELNPVGKAFTDMVYKGDKVEEYGVNRRVKVELYYTIPEVASIGSETLQQQQYSTDNSRNDTITTTSGTRIFVPANAFELEDGTPVTGKVNIRYIEYRDPIDFILGGIPMSHSENGQPYIFNSSGMFAISGEQEGKSIRIMEGKEIGIDFVKTQNVPNTDFFGYDEPTNKWTNIGPTPTNTTVPFVPGLQTNHQWDAQSNCLYTDCEGLAYIGRTGMEYLDSSQPSVYAQLTSNHSYRDSEVLRSYERYREKMRLVKETTRERDSLQREFSRLYNNKYKLELVEHETRKKLVRFKISCENCVSNPYAGMSDMVWEYKYRSKKQTLSLINAVLDHCAMWSFSGSGTTNLELSLVNDRRYITFRKVKPEGTISAERLEELNQLYKDYLRHKRKGHKKARHQLSKKLREVNKRHRHLNKELEVLDQYFARPFHRNNNSLLCFHKESKDYMETAEEQEMPALVWYRYFEKNADLMRARYQPFTDDRVLGDKCRSFAIRDSIQLAKQGIISQAGSKFERMKAGLGISSFGTYNCDQLSRIKDPVEILAEYTNKNDEKLDIASVFMIDHSINSVLVFNGYLDLWPGRFSYGRHSKNTLVAFDTKGAAYICKPGDFSAAVKEPGKTKMFSMTPVGKNATKQELLAVDR